MFNSPLPLQFINSGGTHPAVVRLAALPLRAFRDIPSEDLARVCNIYIDAAHSAVESAISSRLPASSCLLMLGTVFRHAVRIIPRQYASSALTTLTSNPLS